MSTYTTSLIQLFSTLFNCRLYTCWSEGNRVTYQIANSLLKLHTSMCKGLSSLPSSCREKAKEMRVKFSHLAETHHKYKVQDGKAFQDLETLLNNKSGLQAFRGFLRSEFSEENLKFWLACEEYRVSPSKTKAGSIYSQFINPDAPQEVNLDAETREALLNLMDSLCADTFNKAQQRIYSLMAKDSFPRFLRSAHCMETIRAF
ncbi:regulator of G-protein signaling 21 isoform X1 [Morone saxatilis]|uniref:regulator of G-protein signaling 21 isoform X1 n=2 Tax=Morone saxatilis TaxID=34816 RepID=UPI0015E1D66E|nr:regulator of G-protein signaling 21 isoform X1 [Morone saxatilis]